MSAVVGYDWATLSRKWPEVRLKTLLGEVNDPSPDGSEPLHMLSRDRGVLPRDSAVGYSEAESYIGYKRFRTGDLILNKMQAWSGAFGVAPSNGLISPDYAVFRLKPGSPADLSFLLRVLKTPMYMGLFDGLARGMGTGFNRLHPSQLLDVPVSLPASDEQRRIADFLDDQVGLLDRAIQLRQHQKVLLAERRVSLARHATTFGLQGDARKATGVSWMPEIAASWTLGKIGRSFSTGSGTTPLASNLGYFSGEFPWVNTGDLRDGVVTEPRRTVTSAALADYSALKFYEPGALLVAMYGATIGRLGRLGVRACVNQACCVLYNPTDVVPDFAFYWFLGHRSDIIELAAGGGQPNINAETVRSLRIPVPSQAEQAHLAEFLRDNDRHAEQLTGLLSQQEALLRERKQALITSAVTGQLDISTARRVA